MRRKLFNLAAALSLLLSVAVCVLWVRSYWVADCVTDLRNDGPGNLEHALLSSSGTVVIVHAHLRYAQTWDFTLIGTPPGLYRVHASPSDLLIPAGFGFERGSGTSRGSAWGLFLPYWAIAVAASLPAALWLFAKWRSAGRLKQRGFAVEQGSTTAPADG